MFDFFAMDAKAIILFNFLKYSNLVLSDCHWQFLQLSPDVMSLNFLHCVAPVVARWLSFELDLARLNTSPFLWTPMVSFLEQLTLMLLILSNLS